MKKASLIGAFVLTALVVSSPCDAGEPFVWINDVYTTDESDIKTTEFAAWENVVCHIKFTVIGSADRYYRIAGIMRSGLDGDRGWVDRLPPGNYEMKTIHHVSPELEPGTRTVEYKVKLIKRKMLRDLDFANCEITIVE